MIKTIFLSFLDKFKKNGFLTGSAIFFVSATIVNLGNYLFNLILGRWLGPADFSDLSIIVTLFLIVIFLTATLQTITARFAAVHTSDGDEEKIARLRETMLRWAWQIGGIILLVFALGAKFWQHFFHTQSALPFVIFAAGLPFYLAQGVNRGILQGQTRFKALALSYQAEMWTRLLFGIGFAYIGWGVEGGVAGLSLSFIATWYASHYANRAIPKMPAIPVSEQKELLAYSGGVSVAYLSQILINNSDILIIKHFFSPEDAGQYAALALIGRVIFFATWAVVTTLFPIVAQKHQRGERHAHLLGLGLGLVVLVSSVTISASYFFPELIVSILFGKAYLVMAPLLWLYAVATSLYALANVIVNYQLSIGKSTSSYIALLGGIAQVVVLSIWHASLKQVVLLQILLMGIMLFILLLGYGMKDIATILGKTKAKSSVNSGLPNLISTLPGSQTDSRQLR